MAIGEREYLIVEWCLIIFCIIVLVTRLFVRTWKRLWAFWLSEVFLTVAVLLYLALIIGDTYIYATGHSDFEAGYYTPSFAKWMFSTCIIFDTGFYFPRFSLLAFYNELFPISEERLRKFLYAVTAYNVAAFLTVGLMDVFWCGLDVSKNWQQESDCHLVSVTTVIWINWPIGLVAELLVFLLPFGMLQRLKATPKRDKNGLICLFTIGCITVLASVARFTLFTQAIWSYTTNIVGTVEIATQIIVVALPALRPLLPIVNFSWSKISSYGVGSRNRAQDSTAENTLRGSYSTAGNFNPKEPLASPDERGIHHDESRLSADAGRYVID